MHGKESTLPWPAPGQKPERNPPTRCCRIREGPLVNVEVTAAGATMALALIFLKTNNASVASQLRIPASLYSLSCVRPDLVMLRVIARNLIMWEDVRPTSAWLASQLPELAQPPAVGGDTEVGLGLGLGLRLVCLEIGLG